MRPFFAAALMLSGFMCMSRDKSCNEFSFNVFKRYIAHSIVFIRKAKLAVFSLMLSINFYVYKKLNYYTIIRNSNSKVLAERSIIVYQTFKICLSS